MLNAGSQTVKCIKCGIVITYHGIKPPVKPTCYGCSQEDDEDEARVRRNKK